MIYGMTEALLKEMTDADVWRLAAALEALKATASEAQDAGVDTCYVRTLLDLAFAEATKALDVAVGIVGPEEVLRRAAENTTDTP